MNRGQVQGAGPRPRDVVGAALRTYRERFWRVAGTAFVVFGIVAAVDALATVLVIDRHVSRPIAAAVTSAVASVFAMVGVVIYAGILDKVVGAHLHGHRDLSVPQIWSVLPLRRLVIADVVLAVATLVGLALFVVPGVVVFTVWSLVGPVITIEDRSVTSSLRRSWQLVRPHFWLTLCLVTVPLQVEQAVLHAVHYTDVFDHPLVPAFLLNGLLGMVIGSVVGLVEVVLAYDLIDRTDQRAGSGPSCPGRFAAAHGSPF
ncbi:MAG: hypothetical protein ABW122_05495, partial [Ilumatobacteraceae bacterium]